MIMKQLTRIYHDYTKWEEVKYNAYAKINPKKKDYQIDKVIYFFKNPNLINEFMEFVIENFKYSCEHNLTNPNLNHRAWLGQTALAVYNKIPAEITMEAWNFLTEEEQNRANTIAEKKIKRWIKCQKSI